MNERVIEERLEKIAQMLETASDFTANFLDDLKLFLPSSSQLTNSAK